MRYFTFSSILMILLTTSNYAFADDIVKVVDAGDTSWMLIATGLVMLMTPGLGFFYSGMVHSTNAVATIIHSYMKLCVISLIWIIFGYSLAFSPTIGGFIGGLDFIGFNNVGQEPIKLAPTIPHLVFAMFQGMFAVITAAIITGAFAERVRLGPILIFSSIWVILVYVPVAHWIWGGGWITTHLKAIDFAGGAVVHINSGVAGLVAALCLGRRVNIKNGQETRPHNLPLTITGAALLWFGWFGFNAGSALASNGLAALALVNTNAAAASGGVAWFILEYIHKKKSTALGIITGSIAGLVAITPAAGFVIPLSAIVIGIGSSFLCYFAISVLKPKLGYDDSLDAFGLHGIGGIWGAIATGLFATTTVNAAGANGLFYGNPSLVINQILATLVIIIYSAFGTYIILQLVRKLVRIRVSREDEKIGLDSSQHGETGYNLN